MNRFALLLALVTLSATSLTHAQLKSRLDLFDNQYQQDRARSLTLLNVKYIAQYEQELETASQARNLEDVKRISTRLEELKAENAKLADASGENQSPSATGAEKDLLIGKSVYFTHTNGRDEIWVEFEEGNTAIWVGLGQAAVAGWRWERAAPDLIYFWDPNRQTKEQGAVLKLNDDGKGGSVRMNGKESGATIRRTTTRR